VTTKFKKLKTQFGFQTTDFAGLGMALFVV